MEERTPGVSSQKGIPTALFQRVDCERPVPIPNCSRLYLVSQKTTPSELDFARAFAFFPALAGERQPYHPSTNAMLLSKAAKLCNARFPKQ
jgi:hypothetical protein